MKASSSAVATFIASLVASLSANPFHTVEGKTVTISTTHDHELTGKNNKKNASLCKYDTVSHKCLVSCGMCCNLNLKLMFPEKGGPSDQINMFYSSDTMLLKQKRSDDPTHPPSDDYTDVCSSFNRGTEWGCTHEGEAFVRVDPTNSTRNDSDQENVRISDFAGKSFVVQVRHNFADEEVHQKLLGPEDPPGVDMRSRLSAKTNGMRKKRIFKPPRNIGIPTHLLDEEVFPVAYEQLDEPIPVTDDETLPVEIYDPDESGYINPAYKGTYFVDIDCDNDCECKMKKRISRCEVTAKLLPPSDDSSVGATQEKLTVRKEGSNVPSCSIEEPESWWCAHYGDAMLSPVLNLDQFIIYRQAAAVKIPDASASTYIFSISKEGGGSPPSITTDNNEDPYPFSLYIFTPYYVFGPLSVVDTGASISENSWGLSCDHNCNCDHPFELPTI